MGSLASRRYLILIYFDMDSSWWTVGEVLIGVLARLDVGGITMYM